MNNYLFKNASIKLKVWEFASLVGARAMTTLELAALEQFNVFF
jgi:hypothetical protein